MKLTRVSGVGRHARTVLAVALVSLLAASVSASERAHPLGPKTSSSSDWWKTAVFYEVYPRSFMDSNGDGIGDLNGITSKLDYFVDIGVDALWITPFFPSPQVDFGYDVSDYEAVDPQFGTLADFDRLLAEAHKRHIRIVCDLVLNHTSDRHPYFVESRSSRTNPKADWYVWRDPKPGGGPPNNWLSIFGGSAWTLDPTRGQYYYHFFYKEQPDINWRNDDVANAMFDSVRFWLKRGVDGFRVDAIDHIFEDRQLRDNPTTGRMREDGTPEQQYLYTAQVAENHSVFARLRKVTDEFPGTVIVGETGASPQKLLAYYGSSKAPEFQLPFNFGLMNPRSLSAGDFRSIVAELERALGPRPVNYVLSNHDRQRAWDLFGDGTHNAEISKVLTMMLLTLRGVPFVYYGEEIGMKTTVPERKEDVQDPVGKVFWPKDKGRDGERTPMQWTDGKNAGFSTADKTWLPVPPTAKSRNVEVELADSDSILNLFKKVTAFRRTSQALLRGSYSAIGSDPNVFAYRRQDGKDVVVVVLNMSGAEQTMALPAKDRLATAVSTRADSKPSVVDGRLKLGPYEGVILKRVP